jgi:hypothetical protein
MKKAGKGRLSELDIIFSIVLGIFCIYLFFLVGAESPAPTATELGAAFWPRIILVLLILLIIVNIVNSLKKLKGSNEKLTAGFNLGEFLKSKLFVGMILVAVMAILMPIIGFIPVSFLFLIAYGVLLGEKNRISDYCISCYYGYPLHSVPGRPGYYAGKRYWNLP